MTMLGAVCRPEIPPERLRDVARAAEDSGLDELWLWGDCFWGGAVAAASAVLAWTSRLRVGIGVLPAHAPVERRTRRRHHPPLRHHTRAAPAGPRVDRRGPRRRRPHRSASADPLPAHGDGSRRA